MITKKNLVTLLSETPQPPLYRGRGLRLSRASKQIRELAAKPFAAPDLSAELSTSPELSSLPEPPALVARLLIELAAKAATPDEPPIAPNVVADEAPAVAAAPVDSVAPVAPEPCTPERDKRKLLLRTDLLKQCKRIARAQDRKLYQVVEAALEEYIQRYGASK